MLAPKAEKYPLTMLTSHSFHRQHTSQDNNPWLRDEFRHAVHISVVDAKGRAIKDGDLVRVYNDMAEVIMPAHVTSRITPGVVIIRHGAWPELSEVKVSTSMYACTSYLLPVITVRIRSVSVPAKIRPFTRKRSTERFLSIQRSARAIGTAGRHAPMAHPSFRAMNREQKCRSVQCA